MIYSYYPGCTLKDRAKQLDLCARASAKALGMELKELPQWQCCGAVYPQASDEIAKHVVNPLTGRKIGAFYGCMVLRPGKVLAFDDPENPTIIEDFIKCLGATPVTYAYRNECCGAYASMEDKACAENQVERALNSAVAAGCEELITACPLCLYNLVENATQHKLPVSYFTELLAEALGVKEG